MQCAPLLIDPCLRMFIPEVWYVSAAACVTLQLMMFKRSAGGSLVRSSVVSNRETSPRRQHWDFTRATYHSYKQNVIMYISNLSLSCRIKTDVIPDHFYNPPPYLPWQVQGQVVDLHPRDVMSQEAWGCWCQQQWLWICPAGRRTSDACDDRKTPHIYSMWQTPVLSLQRWPPDNKGQQIVLV